MWLGVAVTGFFLWLVLRDAPLREVGHVMAGANWWLLVGLSVPAYVWVVHLRALRWRHLTDPIQPMETGSLFRAVSVGFMANNLFPLRIGEVVRCWYLGRETGAGTAPIFGTVVLERVIDTLSVITLALVVVALLGAGGSDRAIARGAYLLVPVAVVPTLFLLGLRAAPERVIRTVTAVLRPLSKRLAELVADLLRSFSEGLGALRGGTHLAWIALDSLGIWFVGSTIPVLASFWALGLDFGSPQHAVLAAWVTLAAVGVAVALPSAPGFFGPYHFAAKLALERFGVPAETAVAVGTLMHAVFWVTFTGLGLAVLRMRDTSLGEIDRASSGPQTPRRP